MKTIYFATSNTGKALSLQARFDPTKVKIKQISLDIIEPQADTCQEISIVKAKQAYAKLHKPVIVDDSAFHIPALNGFPGPYVKYILGTLGGRGILTTASEISNRHAYFESSLTYISSNETYRTFSGKSTPGVLSDEFVPGNNPESWSELWNIVIPYGSSKALIHFTNEEMIALKKELNQRDIYAEFAQWINNQPIEQMNNCQLHKKILQ